MTDARRQTEPDDRGRQEQPGGYSRERHDTAQAQPSDGAPREVQRSERLSGYDRGRDPRGDGESGHGRGGRRTQSPPLLGRGSPGRQPGGSQERDRPHDSGREREAGHGAVQDRGGPQYQSPSKHVSRRHDERARGQQDVGPRADGGSSLQWDPPRRLASGDVGSRDRSSARGQRGWDRSRDGDGDSDRGRDRGLAQERGPDRSSEHLLERGRERRPDGAAERDSRSAAPRNRSRSRDRDESPGRRGAGLQAEDRHGHGRGGGRSGSRGGAGGRGRDGGRGRSWPREWDGRGQYVDGANGGERRDRGRGGSLPSERDTRGYGRYGRSQDSDRERGRGPDRDTSRSPGRRSPGRRSPGRRSPGRRNELEGEVRRGPKHEDYESGEVRPCGEDRSRHDEQCHRDRSPALHAGSDAAVWAPRPVDELLPMRDRHDHGDVGGGGDDAGRSEGQDEAWQGWAPEGEPAPQREGRGPEQEGDAYRECRQRTQQPGNRTVAAYEEHDGHEAPRAYAEGAGLHRQWLTGPDGSGEVHQAWPAGAQRPQGAGEAQVAARAGSGRHQHDWQWLHQQALLGSGDHGSAATQRQAPAIPLSGPSEPRRQHSNAMPPLPPPALEQLPGDNQRRGSRAPYMTMHGAWTSSPTPLGSASAALSGRWTNSGDSGSRQSPMQVHMLPQLRDRSVALLPPLQPTAPSTGEPPVLQQPGAPVVSQQPGRALSGLGQAAADRVGQLGNAGAPASGFYVSTAAADENFTGDIPAQLPWRSRWGALPVPASDGEASAAAAAADGNAASVVPTGPSQAAGRTSDALPRASAAGQPFAVELAAAAAGAAPPQQEVEAELGPPMPTGAPKHDVARKFGRGRKGVAAAGSGTAAEQERQDGAINAAPAGDAGNAPAQAAARVATNRNGDAAAAATGGAAEAADAAAASREEPAAPPQPTRPRPGARMRRSIAVAVDDSGDQFGADGDGDALLAGAVAAAQPSTAATVAPGAAEGKSPAAPGSPVSPNKNWMAKVLQGKQAVATQASSPTAASAVSSGAGPPGWSLKLHPNTMQFSLVVPPSRINPLAAAPPPPPPPQQQQQPQQTEASTAATSRSPIHDRPLLAAAGAAGGPAAVPGVAQLPRQASGGGMHTAPQGPARAPLPLVPPSMVLPPTDDSPSQSPRARSPAPAPEHAPVSMPDPVPGPVLPSAPVALHPVLLPQPSPQPGAGAATAPVAGRDGTAAAVRTSAGAAGDTDDDFEVEVVRECAAPPSAAGAFAAVGGTAAVATAMHMSLLRDDSACADMSAAVAGPGARAAAGPSRQTGVPPGSPLKEQPQLPTHLQARPNKQSLPQPAASQQSMPLLGAALQAPTALAGELPQQQLAAAVPLAAESRAAGAAAHAGPGAGVESSGCAASDSSAGGPLSLRQQAAEDRAHAAAVGGSKAAEVDPACRQDTGVAAAGGTTGAGVAVDTSPAPPVAPPALRASADVRAAAVAPAVSKQPTGTAAGDAADAVHAVLDSDGHQEQEMAARTLATGEPGVAPAGVPPGVAAAAGSPTARAPQDIPAVALQPEPQPGAGAADPGAAAHASHAVGAPPAWPPTTHALHPRPDAAEPGVAPQGTRAAQTRKGGPRLDPAVRDALNGDAGQMPSTAHRRRSDGGSWSGGSSPSAAAGAGPASTSGTVAPAVGPAGRRARNGSDGTAPAMPPAATPLTSLPPKAKPAGKSSPAAQPKAAPPPAIGDAAAAATAPPATAGPGPSTSASKRSRESGGCSGTGGPVSSVSAAATKAATKAANKRARIEYSAGHAALAASVQPAPPALLPLPPLSAAVQPPLAPMTRSSSSQPVLKSPQQAPKDLAPGVVRAQRTAAAPVAAPVPQPSEPTPTSPSRQRKGVTRPPTEGLNRIFLDSVAQAVAGGSTLRQSKTWPGPIHQRLGKGARAASASAAAAVSEPLGASVHTRITRSTAGAAAGPAAAIAGGASLQAPQAGRLPGTATRTATGSAAAASASTACTVAAVRAAQQASASALAAAEVGSTAAVRGAGQGAAAADDASTPAASAPAPSAAPAEPFPAKPLHIHDKRGLLIPASRLPGLPEHLQLQVVLDDVPLRDTVVAELTKAKSHAAASVPAYKIKPAELRSRNLMGCWLMRLDRQTAEAPQHGAASAGRDVVTLYMSSKEQHSASSAQAEGAGQSAAAAAAAETTGASAGGVGNARAGLEAAATAGPAAQATSTATRGTPPAASNDARAARAARRAAATQSAASGGEARAGDRALDASEEHTAQGPLVPARDPAAAPPEVQAPTQQLQQTQQRPTPAAGVQGATGHVALASDEAAASAVPVPDLAEAAAEAGTGPAARSATDAEVAGPAGACGPRTRSGSRAAAQLSGGAVALGGRAAGGSVGSGGHQSGVEAGSSAQARASASISPGPSARIVSGSPGAAATADGREATPGAAAKIGDSKFLDVEVQGFEPKKGSNSCEIQVYKNGVEIKHLKNIPTVDKAKSTTVRRVSCRHLEDFSDMWVQRWEASGLPRKKHVLKLFLSTSAPQQPQQPPHTEDAGADAGADAARDAAAPAEVPAAVPPEAMAAQPVATPAASCAGHAPAQRQTVAAEPPAQAMPAPQEELTSAPAPVRASGALAFAAPVHPAGPSAAASLAAPAGSAAVAAAWGSAGPDGQAVQSRDVPVDASSAAATQTVYRQASRAPVPDQGPQPAALAQLEAEGYAEAQPPQLLRPEPEAEAQLPPQPQPQVVPVATQEPPGPVAHDGGNVEREAAAPGHRVVAAEALEHVEPAVGPTMPADAAAKADAHCAHAGVSMPRSVPVQAAAPEQEQLPAGPPASGGAANEQAPDGLLAAAGTGGNAGVQPPGPTWPMEGVLEAAVHIKHNRKYLLLPANITEALPQSVSVTAVVDGTDVLDLPWRTLEVRPHDGAMHLYCGPDGPGPLNRMQLLAVVRTAHDRLELRLARPLVVRPSASRQDTAGSGPGARSPAATVATTALSQPLSGASGGATRAGTAKAAAAAGVMGQAVMAAAADPRSALQSNATAASQAVAAAAARPPPPLPPPLLPATQVPTASPPNDTIARGGAGAGSRTAVAVAGTAAAGVRAAEVAGAAAIAVAGDGDIAGNSVAVLSGGGVPTQPIEARQEGPEEAGVPADAHGAAQLLETAAPEEDMAVSAEEQGSLRATARRRPTGEGANASASLSKQGVRTPAGAPATGAAALPSAAEAAAATQAATGAADDELLPRVPPSLRTTVSAAASGTGDDGYAPTHALASIAATPAPHVAVPGGAEAAEVTAVAAVPEAEAQAEAEVATANAGEGGAGAAAAAIPRQLLQQRSPASAAESNDSTPADELPALRQRSVASRAVAVLGAERAAGLGSAGAGGHEATADALVAAGQWAAAGAAGQGGLDAAQPQAAGGARGACVAAAAPEDAVDDAAARDRAGNELVGILSNLARRQQWSNSRASGSGGCGDTELLVPVQRASPEQIQQMSQALSPARRSAAPPAAGRMELAPYIPPVPAPDVDAGAAVAAAGRQLASDDPGAGPPAKRPRMEAAAHAGGTRIFQLPEALFDESLMGPLHSMGLSLLMMTAFSAGPGTGAEDADSDAAAQDPESAATAAELRRLVNEVMSQSRAGVAPYVAKLEFMQRLSTSLLPAAAAPGGLPKRTAYFVDQAFNANVMLALMAHPGLLDGVSANTGGSGAAGPGPAPPGGAGGAAGGGSPATGNPQGPVHDGPGGAGGSGAAGAGAGGAGPSGANPRGGGRGAGNTGAPRAGAQAQDARSQVLSPGVQTRRAMARDGGVLAAGAASSALPGSASASPGVLVPLPAVACPAAAPFVGAAAAVAAAALLGPAGAGPSGPPFADAGGPAALHPTRTDASGIMAPVSAPAQAVTAVAFAAPAPTTTAAASVAEAAPSTSARSAGAVAAGPATAAAAGAGPLGKPPPHPGSLPPLSHGARNGAGTLRRKQLAGTPSQSAACSDNSRGSSQGSPPEESPSTDALRQPLPPPPPQLHLPHPQLQQTQPHARVQPPSQPAAQLEPAPEGQSQPQPQQRQQRHEALHSGSPATGSRRVSPHVADQNAAAAEPSGPRTEVAGPRTRSAAAHEASRAADTNSSGRIGERTAEGGVSQRPRREHKPTKRYIQDDESDGEGEGWRRRPNRRVLLSDSDNQDGVEQQPRRGRDEEEEDSLRGRTTGDAAAALPPPPLPPPPGAAAQAERQTGRLAPAAAVVVAAAAGGRAAPVALVQPGEPGRLGAVARAAVPSVGWVIGLPPGALLPLTVWPNPVEAQGPPQDGRVAVEGGAVYPAFPAQELFYGNGQRWKAGGKLQIHHGMRVGHTDGKRPRLLRETDLALAKEPGQLDKLSVSKSCHACDATFIAAPCEWCGIVGFCSSCYETKLGVSGQMAYTEVMAKCLKCRRLCACKRCVDLPGFGRHKLPRLRTTLDMRQDMARHALRYLFGRGGSGAPGAAGPLLPQGGALGAYLHRERAALAQAGKALEAVKEVDMRKNRTVCDLCCTSIPAMYWCCTSAGCKKEFCLQCCAEGPAEAATTAGGEPAQPRCPWEGCRGHVQLHTFMRKPFHAVVLRAEQEFGPPAAATCAAGQRVAAAAAAPSVSQSFWSPHLVILSETVLRPELFGSAKQRETAQQQALAALRRLQAWKQRQSLQQQRQQAQQPQARDGAEHSIVIQACGSEVAAAELGIGLYRPGQAVPPGKVVAWGRYVLPEQDVRLAKPWWLPGMVNPQGHAPHIFSPLAADLQPSSPRFVPYCLIFQERWALRESVLVRECPMRGDLWCPEGIFRGVEEGIRRCKEQAVRQAMKQTEKKGPAVQAAAVAEAKRKWEGAEALKIINCADGFRQVNDMSGADFAKAFRKGFEPKRTEPAVKPAAEPAAKEFMGKLKDFPPSSDYFEVLPEQWEDFVVRGLPLPWMTRPDEAPLNLATQLPSNANPTDLGPKSYIAFGTPEEFDDGKGTERDSVTKLHQDMSDAVNILNFVQVNAEERDLYGLPKQSPEEVAMAAVDARREQAGAGGTSRAGTRGAGGGDGRSKAAESQAAVFAAAYNEVEAAWREKMPPVRCGNQLPAADDPGYKLAGAEWVIWAPGEDTEALRRYLTAHVGEFQHQGEPIRPEQVDDPVFQQWFFLTRRHLQGLAREQEGRFWVFEQNEGEAVFIPGGCPHQVRNLRSCIKTAVDFVSPEAVDESLAMAAAFRKIPTRDPYAPNFQPYNDVYSDKLQGLLIAMSGAVEQFRTLYPGAYKAQASPVGRSAAALAPAAAGATAAAAGSAAAAGGTSSAGGSAGPTMSPNKPRAGNKPAVGPTAMAGGRTGGGRGGCAGGDGAGGRGGRGGRGRKRIRSTSASEEDEGEAEEAEDGSDYGPGARTESQQENSTVRGGRPGSAGGRGGRGRGGRGRGRGSRPDGAEGGRGHGRGRGSGRGASGTGSTLAAAVTASSPRKSNRARSIANYNEDHYDEELERTVSAPSPKAAAGRQGGRAARAEGAEGTARHAAANGQARDDDMDDEHVVDDDGDVDE